MKLTVLPHRPIPRRIPRSGTVYLRRIAQLSLLVLLAGLLSGCTIGLPFARPAASAAPSSGDGAEAAAQADDTVTIVVTHAVVDRAKRKAFDRYTQKVARALRAGEFDGLVGFSVRRQLFGSEAWTLTVWQSPEALRSFSTSAMHRTAVAEGAPALLRMRSHRYEQPADAPVPTWSEAIALLETAQTDVRGTATQPARGAR
ncbi:MAG: hypothetical protein AAF772_07330 [Acidobacteriota bacterium]